MTDEHDHDDDSWLGPCRSSVRARTPSPAMPPEATQSDLMRAARGSQAARTAAIARIASEPAGPTLDDVLAEREKVGRP